MYIIDAEGLDFHKLNSKLKEAYKWGEKIKIINCNGQRYIGDGITSDLSIDLYGIAGNDLAVFGNGLKINVYGNVQDAAANTMNDGEIVVYGHTGDTLGYAMRGGSIYVRDFAGYRVGIHMKEYKDKIPAIVIGQSAGDFLGEYMAGGVMILLGLNTAENNIIGRFCGTGMHGGVIYIRGNVDSYKISSEVKVQDADSDDYIKISQYVKKYCSYFKCDFDDVMSKGFIKLKPNNARPYEKLYAY